MTDETPVAWMANDGSLHHAGLPAEPFLFVEETANYSDGGRERRIVWNGRDFDAAAAFILNRVAANKGDTYGTRFSYIVNCKFGVLADDRIVLKKFAPSECEASSECPICKQDTPHHHDTAAVEDWREVQVSLAEQDAKFWDEVSDKLSRLKEAYPQRTPLYTAEQVHRLTLAAKIEGAELMREAAAKEADANAHAECEVAEQIAKWVRALDAAAIVGGSHD